MGIVSSFDTMQKVCLKNLTNEDLYNIKVSHDGIGFGDYDESIDCLKKGSFREVSINTMLVNKHCNLVIHYEYDDEDRSAAVYDKLHSRDLTYIVVEISASANDLAFNVLVDDDLEDCEDL